MQFGLFGSAAARRGSPEFDSSEGFRDFIEYNIEAEALGFHSTFVVEHHFTGYGQVSATLNLLTWLGARTRRLRLGTAVLVLPWHNPVLLAEQAATLDLLSGGRLDFGIGKGYRYNEFAGFCVPMEEAEARFDECLEVLLKAWTADEPFSHRGTYWAFDQIVVEPPTKNQGARRVWSDSKGRIWVSEWLSGNLSMHNPASNTWSAWKPPGDGPRPYAVYVDERDKVWISDWGSNAMLRFDPGNESFERFAFPREAANVRQILGRAGEVWLPESGTEHISVIHTA